ncbi:hypothetical protein GTW78_23360 [Streptomyces sp. SID4948]|nr:hypothetical protein [Streptomyces sp. SID4948]MYS23024.1 hypothetical protein [Streptomyces sp. SID4948]
MYGGSPWHLLLLLAAFVLCGYAASKLLAGDWSGVVEWFVGAALLHDLVLVPLYGGADWLLHRALLGGGAAPGDGQRRAARIAAVNHIRVPAFVSLLLLLVYWPLISQRPGPKYALTTGLTPGVFLPRWGLITAALFAGSAVLFGVRRWRWRRRAKEAGRPRAT